jgi:3-oxoacyl-[acyl-carrier protein] reductase
MDLELSNRVALVGGSSRGLGFAIADALAREGCAVALNARDPDQLSRAVAQIETETGADVDGFRADVSRPAAAAELVDRTIRRFGRIDILVCNAGGPAPTTFRMAPDGSWQEALELNLLSTINLCTAVVPGMRDRQWGRIICLASVAAKQPLGSLILSTTARAGVLGFAKALADEIAADGVTVNAVCPGYMHTERVQELLKEMATAEQPPEKVARTLVRDIPMGRMGDPRELAAAVAFLASERASYITGVALQIDGGFVRSIL